MEEPARESEVDPQEFLRALLRISPADARKARANSPAPRKHKSQEGPYQEYGDNESEADGK